MHSVFLVPNYYLQNCVYLYLVPLLLHGIGNLLAYVAALFVTRFAGCLAFVAEKAGCETPIIELAGSKPLRNKVLLVRGFFLSFRI